MCELDEMREHNRLMNEMREHNRRMNDIVNCVVWALLIAAISCGIFITLE
jgi:hypothetical protein